MPTFERRAIEIKQGKLTFYLTYVTPEDLFEQDEFYTVDQLEPKSQLGYQRILEKTRANRLARHLRESFTHGYANIPTTIFLATDKSVSYDSDAGLISFESEEVCPFNVVDGQHRIEGLKRALEQNTDSRLWAFKLPTTIAVDLDHTHQMYHFYIVNTTQRPVLKDLSQQITSRFTDMKGVENLPYLPFWLESDVNKGVDARALRLAEYLNEEGTSPFKGRIRMANDDSKRGNRVNQSSVVTIFKSHIFSGANPISKEDDTIRLQRIMLNYFRAVEEVFVGDIESDDTIVWRDNGLFFFTLISRWVFTEIYASTKDFTVDSIRNTFRGALDQLDDEYQEISSVDWWQRGDSGGASGVNRGGYRLYSNGFLAALNRTSVVDIKL